MTVHRVDPSDWAPQKRSTRGLPFGLKPPRNCADMRTSLVQPTFIEGAVGLNSKEQNSSRPGSDLARNEHREPFRGSPAVPPVLQTLDHGGGHRRGMRGAGVGVDNDRQ